MYPNVRLLLTLVFLTTGSILPGAAILVKVDPGRTAQTIQGFGASINAWTAPMYALYYDQSFVDYAANDLGMSVFRLQMWGGVSPMPIEKWEDISYKDFKWNGDGLRGKMNVDFAKSIVSANKEVKVIGTVWSGPGWMKENNSRTGTAAGFLLSKGRDYDDDNRLRDDRYKHFAKWVVEWAKYMEEQGTPFYAISLANELMFTQWFESTLYTPEEYARIVRVTGEMFASEGVKKPLFFGPEDMTLATYADAVRHKPYVDALMQPDVSQYFDAFATHGYSDGVNEDDRQNVKAYWEGIKSFGKPYWITEGGSGEHDWPKPVTQGIAPRLHTALVEGHVSLFCGWQLAGGPGGASDHNFMEWDQPTKKTFVTKHFWHHIRPGAVRLETVLEQPVEGVLISAYKHKEKGTATCILINQTDSVKDVTIGWGEGGSTSEWKAFQTSESLSHTEVALDAMGSGHVRIVLPPVSITTVAGKLTD